MGGINLGISTNSQVPQIMFSIQSSFFRKCPDCVAWIPKASRPLSLSPLIYTFGKLDMDILKFFNSLLAALRQLLTHALIALVSNCTIPLPELPDCAFSHLNSTS